MKIKWRREFHSNVFLWNERLEKKKSEKKRKHSKKKENSLRHTENDGAKLLKYWWEETELAPRDITAWDQRHFQISRPNPGP